MPSELTTGPAGSGPGPAEAYLLLPVLIFWGGYVGGVSGGLLALAPLAWIGWCRVRGIGGEPLPGMAWLSGALLALVVLGVMGFPQGPWAWDWFKHWALMGALADHAWPVRLELRGEEWGLRFYLAAYLVPGLLVKAWPALGLRWAAALWFGLGIGVLLAQVAAWAAAQAPSARRAGTARAVWLAPALFLLLAGADGCIEYGLRLLGFAALPGPGLHTEWWMLDWFGILWQFTGPLAALTWVPHQAIATFLVAFALARRPEQAPWGAALGLAVLALWSPFGLVGLLPVLAWRLAWSWREWWGRRELRWLALAGLLLLSPLVFAAVRFLSSELPATGLVLPTWAAWRSRLAPGVLFVALELLPCALILGRRLWADGLLRLCMLELLVIALLGGGEPPDFVMRASAGPLAIIMVHASVGFSVRWAQGKRAAGLALVGLAISLPTSLNEALYHLNGGAAHRALPIDDVMRNPSRVAFSERSEVSVPEFFDACGWRYLPQYFVRRPAYFDASSW